MATAVVTAAFPSTNKLNGSNVGSNGGRSTRELSVPDSSLLVLSRGPLQTEQLAVALQTSHQGCEGVSRFVHLALANSFRETLVKSGDPALAV